MSLQNFHVLFISLAVVLAIFCALLAAVGFRESGSMVAAAAAVAAVGVALLLVGFERRFLRRCREAGI